MAIRLPLTERSGGRESDTEAGLPSESAAVGAVRRTMSMSKVCRQAVGCQEIEPSMSPFRADVDVRYCRYHNFRSAVISLADSQTSHLDRILKHRVSYPGRRLNVSPSYSIPWISILPKFRPGMSPVSPAIAEDLQELCRRLCVT